MSHIPSIGAEPLAVTKGRSVPAIQILRAFAAVAVAVAHVPGAFLHIGRDLVHDLGALTVGVDVFFIISGFIMLHVERERGVASAGRFLVRRAIRIVPLYWIVTTIAVVAHLHQIRHAIPHSPVLTRAVTSYLFWPYSENPDEPWNGAPIYPIGWTLNYEAFFYAGFAILMVFNLRYRLGIAAIALGALIVVGQRIEVAQPLLFWTRPNIAEFAFGMAVAEAFRRGWSLRPIMGAGLAVLAVGLFVAGFPAQDVLVALVGDYVDDTRVIAMGVPGALLVAAAVLTPWTPRTGVSRALLFLGDASFSIYLVHYGLYDAIAPAVGRGLGPHPSAIGVCLACAALLLAAILAGCAVHLAIERPMHRWMKRVLVPSGRRQSVVEPGAAPAPLMRVAR